MHKRLRFAVAFSVVTGMAVLVSGNGSFALDLPPGAPAEPVGAVAGVVDALRRHPIVAIGESHNLQEAGAFYKRLVRSESFAGVADVVVVEFGNSLFQPVIDRYVRGGSVRPEELRSVWQDTTQVGAWDAPMYRRFFSAVRAANADRPEGRRIRVLLGDPPIDWGHIQSAQEVERFLLRRERFMANLIDREVIQRGKRGVVIAGLAHLERSTTPSKHPNVTQMLDRRHPGEVWVVGAHLGFPKREWEDALIDWPTPSITPLHGTWIGMLPKAQGTAQDALDAMLYLGAPDSLHLSTPLPSVYVRDGYWQTLKERWPLGTGGTFTAARLFSDFSDAGYPGLFSQSQIQALQVFARCMRRSGVESFPDPQFQYDAVGFYGPAVHRAEKDPDFREAFRACAGSLRG